MKKFITQKKHTLLTVGFSLMGMIVGYGIGVYLHSHDSVSVVSTHHSGMHGSAELIDDHKNDKLVAHDGILMREPSIDRSFGNTNHAMHGAADEPIEDDTHTMSHGTQEVSQDNIPTVLLKPSKGPMGDVTLQLITTNYTFTPELAESNELVENQGHAHLYINGEKMGRVYSNWHYVPAEMIAENSVIEVILTADNHDVWTLNQEPIKATAHVM